MRGAPLRRLDGVAYGRGRGAGCSRTLPIHASVAGSRIVITGFLVIEGSQIIAVMQIARIRLESSGWAGTKKLMDITI